MVNIQINKMNEYKLFQYAWELFGKGYSQEAVIRQLTRKCHSRALAEEICAYLLRSATLMDCPPADSYYD